MNTKYEGIVKIREYDGSVWTSPSKKYRTFPSDARRDAADLFEYLQSKNVNCRSMEIKVREIEKETDYRPCRSKPFLGPNSYDKDLDASI